MKAYVFLKNLFIFFVICILSLVTFPICFLRWGLQKIIVVICKMRPKRKPPFIIRYLFMLTLVPIALIIIILNELYGVFSLGLIRLIKITVPELFDDMDDIEKDLKFMIINIPKNYRK